MSTENTYGRVSKPKHPLFALNQSTTVQLLSGNGIECPERVQNGMLPHMDVMCHGVLIGEVAV